MQGRLYAGDVGMYDCAHTLIISIILSNEYDELEEVDIRRAYGWKGCWKVCQ